MKKVLKVILKYLIVFALAFVGSIILVTYLKDGSFGFNIRYMGTTTPIVIVLLVCGSVLVIDLMRILDGKTKSKSSDMAED